MITPARRIAVVRALQLGDMLVAVPALRALRAGYPDAEITLIGLPWAASFAARLDRYVNLFLPFPGWPGIDETPYDEARTEQFIAEARAHDYDLVVQMHGSGGQSNPFALALGGRVTAGYYDGPHPRPMANWPLDPYPQDRRSSALSRARKRGAILPRQVLYRGAHRMSARNVGRVITRRAAPLSRARERGWG